MIKIPNENPSGDRTEIASHILKYLNGRGLAASKHEPRKGIINVVSRIGKGKTLIFQWPYGHCCYRRCHEIGSPSFGGEILNGNLYGRGAFGMKGGLAAFIAAYSYFADLEKELDDKLVFMTVADEEKDGVLGTKCLFDKK